MWGTDLSLQTLLREICGPNATLSSNNDEIEVKSFVVVVFVTQLSPNEVMMRDRVKNLENSIEEGRTVQMSSTTIERAASGGFVADEDRDFVVCPACKRRVRVDRIEVSDMLEQHTAACPYPYLCERGITKDLYRQQHFITVVEHLCQQWVTTKVTVALEMEFHPCLVLVALARRHFRHERAFPNAGVLVEALMDMEDPDNQRPPVLWDVTLLVEKLEMVKEQQSRNPGATGVSTTMFEQQPVCSKAEERQRNLPNSPPNSLVTQNPPTTQDRERNRESLLEETMSLVYRWRCKNCGKVDADQLITDCGHLSLCSECLRNRSSCPICETKVTNTIRIYGL